MGRKKKATSESPGKTTNYLKTLDNKKKTGIRSVQEMDDSTYMYMLIVGQLMFDRRHLIAEELAADLSLSALALASSDALLRIIKKSREVQHSVVSNCEPSSNIKYKFADKKRAAASLRKEDSLCNSDIKPAVGTDLVEEEHANSPDGAIAEEDGNESTEETSGTLPEESSKKKTEDNNTSPTKKDTLPPHFSSDLNIPRETADGKIIMVYVPQEKFPCPRPNCKQNFLTKENLDYHLVCSRIHNPQFVKDWGCRYCGKEFSGMSHVKQHEKMKHEEHDKEVCYECGKQFDSLEKMKRHIDVHHLQKKYKCKVEKMKRHIDVHHLQKKYKCKDSSCQMEFSSESGAKYHYKRVHLNDQIPCTIAGCPRKFDRNCDLRRHLEKAHRDGQLVVPSARAPPKQLQHQLQPQQQQQHQQCEAQQEVLPVVEHTPDQQQSLLPSQFPQETTYTTMQTVSQQMTMPGTVMPGATLDPQQQLNQEQLQAIQSLQYLQQHQQQPQPHPPGPSQQQFPPATSNYHGGYMY